MTVTQSIITRPKPGRRHDAVALAVEASKLLERHGADDCRLLDASVAGEMSGCHVFTTEFENGASWGEFTDSLFADAELQALLDRVERDDSPIVTVAMSIATEIPLGRNASTRRGSAVEAYISRVLPGRFEGAVGLANIVFDFVEAQGGSNCRLSQMSSAGSMTDCLVASWELENMRAVGRLGDAYASEPEGQRIMEMLTGTDGPITPVASGIYADIPL
jgi:hypothetical protein